MERNPNSDYGKEYKEIKDNKDFKEFGRQPTRTTFKKRDSIFSNDNESVNGFNSVLFLASEFTADSDSEAIIPIKKVPDINEVANLKRNSVQMEANYSNFPFNFNNLEYNFNNKELDMNKGESKFNNLLNINPSKVRRFSTPIENLINEAKIITETDLDKKTSIKSKESNETETDTFHDYFQLAKEDKNNSNSNTIDEPSSLNNQVLPNNLNNVLLNNCMKSTFKKQNTFNNIISLNNNLKSPIKNNTKNEFFIKSNTNNSITNSELSSFNACMTSQVGFTNTNNTNSTKPILLINNQPVTKLRMKNQQLLDNLSNQDKRQLSPGLWNKPIFPTSSNSSSNLISSLGGPIPGPTNATSNLLGCSNQGMTIFAPYSPSNKAKENSITSTNSPYSQNYNNDNKYLSSNFNSPIKKVQLPLPHFNQPITMNTMVYHNLLVSQNKKIFPNKKDLDNSGSISYPINCSSADDKKTDGNSNSKQSKKIKKKQNTREGDWICLECQNLNFSFRNVCNKCSYERKIDEKDYKS